MKTVNLTIDEDTWRAARRLAAERDTSVSALVREALEHLTKTSERRDQARREIRAMIGSFGGRVGVMPSLCALGRPARAEEAQYSRNLARGTGFWNILPSADGNLGCCHAKNGQTGSGREGRRVP